MGSLRRLLTAATILTALASMLALTSGNARAVELQPSSTASRLYTVERWALARDGAPYWWAGTGPGYDCSGLVMMAYRQIGVYLPHNAAMMWRDGYVRRIWHIHPGELIFYGGSWPYHVAMFIGNGKQISAVDPAHGVEIQDVTSGEWGYVWHT